MSNKKTNRPTVKREDKPHFKGFFITAQQLKELPEYSTSMPTGTYIGKLWKADLNWWRNYEDYQANYRQRYGTEAPRHPVWQIRTYEKHPTEPEKYVKNGYYYPLVGKIKAHIPVYDSAKQAYI